MQGGLSAYDRLFLWFFYFVRSLRFDLPENQVGWRSRQNQEIRFRQLAAIGDLKGQRVLDLGCGLGCLYGYLRGQGWDGDYTGIDILDLMVQKSRRRFPEARFEKRDILKNPPSQKWDYIFINGVFNHRVKDNWAWIEQTVLAALASAEKGLAFNILNSEAGWMDSELFYADPQTLENKVRGWSKGNYQIVRGYLPEDITVYLRR